MTEAEFRQKYPDLVLRVGQSSEDGTWWADARQPDGHCVRALRGKQSLSDALLEIEKAWKSRRATNFSPVGLKSKPDKYAQSVSTYGVIEDFSARDAAREEDEPSDY